LSIDFAFLESLYPPPFLRETTHSTFMDGNVPPNRVNSMTLCPPAFVTKSPYDFTQQWFPIRGPRVESGHLGLSRGVTNQARPTSKTYLNQEMLP
jgi:hypothetical protein